MSSTDGHLSRKSRRNWFVFRLVITLGALFVAYDRVQPTAVLGIMGDAAPGLLVISFVALVAERLVSITRWAILLRAQGARFSAGTIARIYWRNNFFGLLLPTAVGLDVLNALSATRLGLPGARATSTVLVDRAFALLSLAILVLFSVAVTGQTAGELGSAIALLSIGILGLLACVFLPVGATLTKIFPRSGRLADIAERIQLFHDAVRSFRRTPLSLAANLGLGIAVQFLRVVEVCYIVRAFIPAFTWAQALAVVPATNVITALPLSIGGGLGLRENAYLYFFPRVGVSDSISLAVSVLVFAWVVAWVVPGGLAGLLFPLRDSSTAPSGRSSH